MWREVAESLGISLDHARVEQIDREHPFDPHAEPLRQLASRLDVPEEAFYAWLLPIPLRLRSYRSWERLRARPGISGEEAARLVAAANARLRVRWGYDT